MVAGASAGPKEKSAPLTGGNIEGMEFASEVGCAKVVEQLISGVGVSGMIMGCSTTVVGIGVDSTFEAHALRIKMTANDNKIKKIRFMGVSNLTTQARI